MNNHDKVDIEIIGNRALVFDLQDVKKLREWNIAGVLSGTLAVAPQQNIFLGLPLQLTIEEVLYLVASKRCYLVIDKLLFRNLIASYTNNVELLEMILKQRLEDFLEGIKRRKLKIEKIQKLKRKKPHAEPINLDDINSFENQPFYNETDFYLAIDVNDINLIFYKNEINSKKLPNYDTIMENLRIRDQSIQKVILFRLVKNYIYTKLQIGKKVDEYEITKRLSNFCIYDSITENSNYEIKYDFSKFEEYLNDLQMTFSFYNKIILQKQYFLSPGLRFGGKFVGYPSDPLRYHSHLIMNFFEYYNEDIGMLNIVNGGRLATGVKKLWVCIGNKNKKSASINDINNMEEKITKTEEEIDKDINSFVEDVFESKDEEDKNIVGFSIEWAGFG
ncbi:tRNA splicing endonuclease subunit SEN34 ASCRUDRAFT_73710 [Ascoidea rubescens DSM 1968]|uniref:tRNA-intron lyase n=1 Tax=Ascoidea rubescens DSM 1968 TaxID=1344418 RepID=A0A1D2VQV1_9ASCO|nr:hypothetical protein ASCRUDRAFT_73710 [Ascoidea rubescens DSM 1968]ODV63984.1 hypothetical protein ASCRUDRAFT_73710 [Ascoidea rubescens DSM 1968]